MNQITIAPATSPELPACLALLPMLVSPDTAVFAARDGDGSLAGAAGVLVRAWGEPAGMPGWVHVLPDCRRRGVGRQLLTAIAGAAAEQTAIVWAAQSIGDDSDGGAFARACGAEAAKRQLFFASDADVFVSKLDDVVGRLQAHGRVPVGPVIEPLGAGNIDAVKVLVAEAMRSPPPHIERLLARAMTESPDAGGVDRERSCVLRFEGEVVGALLSRRLSGENASHVVCNVVAPGRRLGWANPYLVRAFTRTSLDAGCARIGFDCAEDVRDTIGLARRAEADHVKTETLYRYAARAAGA